MSTASKKLADVWVRNTGCLLIESTSWKPWPLRVSLETANGMAIEVSTLGYGCKESRVQEGSKSTTFLEKNLQSFDWTIGY